MAMQQQANAQAQAGNISQGQPNQMNPQQPPNMQAQTAMMQQAHQQQQQQQQQQTLPALGEHRMKGPYDVDFQLDDSTSQKIHVESYEDDSATDTTRNAYDEVYESVGVQRGKETLPSSNEVGGPRIRDSEATYKGKDPELSLPQRPRLLDQAMVLSDDLDPAPAEPAVQPVSFLNDSSAESQNVQGMKTNSIPEHAPGPAIPVKINNRIYNDYEDEDLKLEAVKKELQAYKEENARDLEELRIKKEIELQRLLKEEAEAAIEKYKVEMAEKAAKEKKEKGGREKEYQKRMEEDLRKSGIDERQIAAVLKKDNKGVDPARPTWTRMARRHLSIETLNRYRIDYEFDQVNIILSISG